MKTSFRLMVSAVAVAFITLAASGAPLPFLDELVGSKAHVVATLDAPLASGPGGIAPLRAYGNLDRD